METIDVDKITDLFAENFRFLKMPKNSDEYDVLVDVMNRLLFSNVDEFDPLLAVVSDLIEKYDETHHAMNEETESLSPLDMLKFQMEQHGMKQKDLVSVFGSQGRVSEILGKKRELNLNHIRKLSKLFGVPKSLFL